MAARHRRHRTALAITAALLTVTTAAGCGALDKAIDCVQTADAIATSVNNLQQAVTNASNDPSQASEALDDIEKELGNLGDKTDNADLSKAVDDLRDGVGNVRDSIDKGDETPDITPVTDAAKEIGKVCTP
uniref:Secreted protein n=1 Tax=Streptomyces sp. NBC_00008 TaxID=2903610 RepID=A0AAU2VWK7_9ACTN